ncbi:MAG: FAD-dependent oxidoreductase [Deltaproteobacteria bacterium]|nr:FAD-dependent oxidoreductase [Deltaproteobacteria bacterium]
MGKRVVIVGGNAVGLETALHLAEQGTIPPEVLHFLAANRAETWDTLEGLIDKGNKEVTVVEMLKEYGKDIGLSTRWTIRGELKRLGVEVITGAKAVEVNPDGLEIEKEKGRELLKADSIVIAAGTEPLNGLRAEIRGLAPEIYTIGDAEKPRKALDAIKEGLLTGLMV